MPRTLFIITGQKLFNRTGTFMEIFDQLNLYLLSHPVMLAQLEFMFRMKFWIFLGLALYFITLPYRDSKKQRAKEASKDDNFLA